MSQILLISDDQEILSLCEEISNNTGVSFVHYYANDKAIRSACETNWDLVLIHAPLADSYGVQACESIRKCKPLNQIFVISAELDQSVVNQLLIEGADDVITLPVNRSELTGRALSALRRSRNLRAQGAVGYPVGPIADSSNAIYQDVGILNKDADSSGESITAKEKPPYTIAGDVRICKFKQEVSRSGQQIPLTHTEYTLLCYLVDNSYRACSKVELLDNVLGYDDENYTASLHSHVSRLRRKLTKSGSKSTSIETLWRYGYRFISEPSLEDSQLSAV